MKDTFEKGDCVRVFNHRSKEIMLCLFVCEYTDNTSCVMNAQDGKFYKVLTTEQIQPCEQDEIDVIKEEWGVKKAKLPHSEPINIIAI
jgi:hypothetical protein